MRRILQVRPFSSRLALDTINGNVIKAEYAVRGHIAVRSEEVSECKAMSISGHACFTVHCYDCHVLLSLD